MESKVKKKTQKKSNPAKKILKENLFWIFEWRRIN